MPEPGPSTGSPSGSPASQPVDLNKWKIARGGAYDLNRFYTRSRDDDGHSDWVARLRLPPDVYDQAMAMCVKDSPYPYRHLNELIRDALVHRMAYLAEQWPAVEESFHRFLMNANVYETLATKEKMREHIRNVCRSVDRIAQDYIDRNQPVAALGELDELLDGIQDPQDPNEVYVKEYIESKKEEVLRIVHGDAIVDWNKKEKARALKWMREHPDEVEIELDEQR